MSYILLDTSVVSFLHPRKKETALRKKYVHAISEHIPVLCFQTVAELLYWAEKQGWEQESQIDLRQFIKKFLIVPYTFDLAEIWAAIKHLSSSAGRRLEAGDCWIAATAVHHGIPLLTDDRDFIDLSIKDFTVINYAD